MLFSVRTIIAGTDVHGPHISSMGPMNISTFFKSVSTLSVKGAVCCIEFIPMRTVFDRWLFWYMLQALLQIVSRGLPCYSPFFFGFLVYSLG